ncbi:MAG: flagellar basal body-associated protein FliL [Pseudolabrys sp.]|nr:flagellar basal body-associated protein FliL [Pseudolabrys sp.]MBV9261345.1 flagellar basal body-associated protein FliL [Pseudolabrys sp.]
MAAKAKAAEAAQEDTAGDAAEQPAQPKRKFALPSLKIMIIGAAAFAVLAGGGTYGYLHFFSHEKKEEAVVVKPAVFVDMPDVLVNLANSGPDRTQYLKVKVVLELPEQNLVAQIQPLMPRVMDAFQTYLRELRPTDLDGSAGLYRLKEELTRRVNVAVAPNKVTAVLFKEIVVQ